MLEVVLGPFAFRLSCLSSLPRSLSVSLLFLSRFFPLCDATPTPVVGRVPVPVRLLRARQVDRMAEDGFRDIMATLQGTASRLAEVSSIASSTSYELEQQVNRDRE